MLRSGERMGKCAGHRTALAERPFEGQVGAGGPAKPGGGRTANPVRFERKQR